MRRSFEQLYPYVFSLLLAGIFYFRHEKFPTGEDILSASITIGAVFTGFLATLKSIIISIQGPKMDAFRATKFFNALMQYLKEAIWLSLAYCGWSLFGFFCDPTRPPFWFGATWVFLGAATLLSFLRVSSILIKLIESSK